MPTSFARECGDNTLARRRPPPPLTLPSTVTTAASCADCGDGDTDDTPSLDWATAGIFTVAWSGVGDGVFRVDDGDDVIARRAATVPLPPRPSIASDACDMYDDSEDASGDDDDDDEPAMARINLAVPDRPDTASADCGSRTDRSGFSPGTSLDMTSLESAPDADTTRPRRGDCRGGERCDGDGERCGPPAAAFDGGAPSFGEP